MTCTLAKLPACGSDLPLPRTCQPWWSCTTATWRPRPAPSTSSRSRWRRGGRGSSSSPRRGGTGCWSPRRRGCSGTREACASGTSGRTRRRSRPPCTWRPTSRARASPRDCTPRSSRRCAARTCTGRWRASRSPTTRRSGCTSGSGSGAWRISPSRGASSASTGTCAGWRRPCERLPAVRAVRARLRLGSGTPARGSRPGDARRPRRRPGRRGRTDDRPLDPGGGPARPARHARHERRALPPRRGRPVDAGGGPARRVVAARDRVARTRRRGEGGGGRVDHRARLAPDAPARLRAGPGRLADEGDARPRPAAPPGGEIVRDARGAPTGILKEKAQELVTRIVPPPAPDKLRRGILAALDLAARTGVTSVQSEVTPAELDVYGALRAEGRLTVRIYGWLPLTMEVVRALEQRGERAASGDAWVRTGLLKAYADGTLGSRTAYMLEPYSDDPSTRGIQRIRPAEMDALVLAADRAGLQVAVHAIGDAANREVLDAIERAAAATGRRGARHRIEHAQVLDAADIPRFARLGAIASMQPTHATSDMRWAEVRIGHARAEEGAYAWRRLLDASARVAFGTDFAVEPLDPVEGLYSAVTRQSREKPGTPPGGWLPSQRLSMEEAISLYTASSAYAEFQEDAKGTLEPGKLADLVVWERDLLTAAPEQILQAKPVLTVVGGRAVFDAGAQR